MTESVTCIDAEDSLGAVARLMVNRRLKRVPVLRDGLRYRHDNSCRPGEFIGAGTPMTLLLVVPVRFSALLFAAPWIYRVARDATGWLLAMYPLAGVAVAVWLSRSVPAGELVRETLPWVPELGLSLSFALDGLSLLFVCLIGGIGSLVLIYAGGYLKDHPQLGRFYLYLLLFMASMLGLVLADNLLALFIFWEGTSISSYLLIGFKHSSEAARKSALQALLITGGGGLALLAGLILLGVASGIWELSQLQTQGEAIRTHALYTPILILILVGAFTKSAQFPFHFWLPNAMEAPTPVSAYLHSATMVKAGVYLLARLSPDIGRDGTVDDGAYVFRRCHHAGRWSTRTAANRYQTTARLFNGQRAWNAGAATGHRHHGGHQSVRRFSLSARAL
jgi:multicomponent Na+:H+ antiporter subunit A